MSTTSRTGLLPTPKHHLVLTKNGNTARNAFKELPQKLEATPIGLSLRPLDGIYNPYKKGCSLLCNHPAPEGVRDLIQQVKTTFSSDARNTTHTAQQALHKLKEFQKNRNLAADSIPEDLFRRYTDTDSRPLTPTPTIASGHTLTSSVLNARRCITPEPGKAENFKRKQIILDLRRSHSQETLYWKPSASEMSQGSVAVFNASTETKERTEVRKKNVVGKVDGKQQQKLKTSKSTDGILRGPKPLVRSSVRKAASQQEATTGNLDAVATNQNDTNNNGEERSGANFRRGKQRRKRRRIANSTLRLREDPETLIATLGPDSMNPSTRPSLIPNSCSLLNDREKTENGPVILKDSCLTAETFRVLKKELDIDTIENTFGRYLNRALREAIKYVPPKERNPKFQKDDSRRKSTTTFVLSHKMPRKLSKSATCFEVPLDLSSLEKMSVFEYLSKYVWLSRQRKQLYKRVFLKYLTQQREASDEASTLTLPFQNEELPSNEYVERTMQMRCLPEALEDVLDIYGTERNISGVLRLLDFENLKIKVLDFRTWCGIVAFAERFAQHDGENTDSCNELEKADFNTMEQWLDEFRVAENLLEVFRIIRSSHFLPFE